MRPRVHLPAVLLLLAALSAPAWPATDGSDGLRPGEALPRVVVRDQPDQSYALYLPPGYSAERSWPTLYCFDPRGRGMLCLNLFREAAGRYGYIVASSNNSRSDGPMQPNIDAMKAVWKDTHARLSIDDTRFYTTGFSGGARVANILAQLLGGAGVIACGAGFPPSAPPTREIPFAFYAMVGRTDFNYYEVRTLDETLDPLGIPHRVTVFDGAHTWAAADEAEAAIEWMELQAMRSGKRPRDDEWLERQYRKRLAAARSREAPYDLDAWRSYQAIAQDFAGLRDVTEAERAAAKLSGSKAVVAELRERRREDRAALEYLDRLAYVLERLRSVDRPLPSLDKLRTDLKLPELSRKRRRGSGEEALAASRLLAMVHVQASLTQLMPLWQQGEFARAALLLAVAVEIEPERATTWYNLACARALAGDTRRSLAALERAVDAGFRDAEKIRTDPDLDALRELPGYRELLASLSAAP